VLSTASAAAKQPPVFNQDSRFSFFQERKKKSAVKRKKASHTAKIETPFLRYATEKRRFILPTMSDQFIPHCRCAALHNG
jgi:hypothetical protein